MIPQDSFVIIAQIRSDRIDDLRTLLTTMNFANRTGFADPANQLVPFGAFETIHYARFVVLADNTLADRAAYPQLPRDEPTYLCFMVDCDGAADELMAQMAQRASGLRKIFGHCEGYDETADLPGWLHAHRVQPMASYVNWVGRTAVQVQEEARLHG